MLTTYIDESGQEGRNEVVLAGYVGDEDSWNKLENRWRQAISPRSHLHMADLRWKHRRTADILKRITGIPELCGLKRIIAGVDVRDYADMFPEHMLKGFAAGYTAALRYFLSILMHGLPKNERVHLYFERQDRFTKARDEALIAFSDMPCYFTDAGVSPIAGWETIRKCTRLEPADALAYAALVDVRSPGSRNALLTKPLLGDRRGGRFAPRGEVRSSSRLLFQLRAAGVDVDLFDSYARERLDWLRSAEQKQGPIRAELYQISPDQAIGLLREVVVTLLAEKYKQTYADSAPELAEGVFNFAILTTPSRRSVAMISRDQGSLIEILAAGVHLNDTVARPLTVAYCVRHLQFWPTYARQARELEARSRLLKIPILSARDVFDIPTGSAFLVTVAVYAKSLLAKHKLVV